VSWRWRREAALGLAVSGGFTAVMVIAFARGHSTATPVVQPRSTAVAAASAHTSQAYAASTPTPTSLPTAVPTPSPTPAATPRPKAVATARATATPQPGPVECKASDFSWNPPPTLHATPGTPFSFQTYFPFGPSANGCLLPASVGHAWIEGAGGKVGWCPETSTPYFPQSAPPSPDTSGGVGPPISIQCDWPVGTTGQFSVHMTITVSGSVIDSQVAAVMAG
jgi:hypothetical protein